ncbi:hypothetical protein CAPTEDRAFT_177506 [Capitella teleta]|uniref:Solute carrier family 23 member 2 n=1 Tax=Capitella teleta TaxID=283909 RepID=R7TV38_CAPTE|nr:hypothetical protein CAPTEDRAFT_177506 [Capitella teleta]|eukprot:ELT94865.1 hypothetical protein CAPTEDRAFT_177506 [Capitella teleta]
MEVEAEVKPTLPKDPVGLDLQYKIDDVPPWYLCIMLGFQHYLTMFGATLSIPLIVAPMLCVGNDTIATAEILGTILFVSGLVTCLQSTIGCRLPIIQGGTFAFLVPATAILRLEQFQCPLIVDNVTNITFDNSTPPIYTGSPEHTEVWQIRMREIQGAIIASSLFQVAIGFSGVIGILLKYIGPLAIAPTISLIGLSLFQEAAASASQNWWIALMTIVLITLFSQYLRDVDIPCFSFDRKNKKCSKSGYPVFKLFPVILAIIASWSLCGILTATNAIPDDPNHWAYPARTDNKTAVLSQAKWFRFPYPGQWGTPTFSTASVFGMLAGVLAGMIESVGDYYAAARLSGAPPPPVHAINRGVFTEGFGCVLSGCWGTGTGTTSYSENIGAIGITKVGSRRVIQVAGVIIMILGMIGKFGALFVTIPDPIVGGVFLVMFGMITAVGISNLQFVDLNSSRNLFIFGFSMFFGLSLPQWLASNTEAIHTGSDIADQIFTVLLSSSMFVGGVIGFFLDNTVPGTAKERGIVAWNEQLETGDSSDISECYDLPYVTKYIRRWNWASYIPLSPTFAGCCGRRADSSKQNSNNSNENTAL